MDLHVYPSALSRDRAVREAARAQGTLFDHRHFTYAELGERLYRAESLPGRLIELPMQTVFIRHSLTAVLGEAPSPGLVAEYRGVIEELKAAGLEVADVGRIQALIAPALPAEGRQALQQLVQVFQGYQQHLARAGLVDGGDRDLAVLTRLQRHRAAGTKPAWLRHLRRVVVHDIYHLSLVHYAIVSLLIQLAEDGGVLQHFSSGTNVDAVRFAEFTWQRFVADESLAALVLPEFARPRERGGNLEALSERLFVRGPAPEPLQPDGAVTVIAAPGRAREVEAVVRRIRELLERGVAPERIAIVVRHLEQYGDRLEATARRYGVPLWFRRGLPLFHVPLTKTVFSLLDLVDSPYPRQALLKVLTSAYVRLDGAWPDDVVGLVNAVGYLDRTHAPLPQLLQEDLRRRRPSQAEAQRIDTLAAWVEALQTALDGFLAPPRPFLAHLEALKALLLQLGFFRAMGMHPEVPLPVVQRDREALRLIFDTLWTGAEALRLLGDAPLDFATFRLLAIDLLREVSLEQPLPSAGAVRVLGVRDVLGLDFDHVFVPGLADTEFPQHYSDHPVLDDAARQALNPAIRAVLSEKFAAVLDRRLLGRALLTTADRAREEPLLFFLALEAANRSCVLSYPSRTADGETMFPSLFVDEVLRHFRPAEPAAPLVIRLPALPSVPPWRQCLEPGELLRRAALAWQLADTAPAAAALGAVERAFLAHGVDVERLRQTAQVEGLRKRYLLESRAAGGVDGAAFGDLSRSLDLQPRLLAPDHPWSPTMLEDLAACPFAFFAAHVLRLNPRVEPDYDVSPAFLGELAHDILAEYWRTEPPCDAAAAVQRMRGIAQRVLSGRGHGPGAGHPGFWRVRQAELLAILEDLAAYLATQQPEAYRTRYREHAMTGVAPCGAWSICLTGRVDRVAVREGPAGITGVLVQDFKYSGNAARYRERLRLDALGQTSFQLPVYLYLALQQLARDGHQVASDAELRLEYLVLKEVGRKALDASIDPTFFDPDRAGSFWQGMRRAIEPAVAGRFVPRPVDPKQTCAYCAYTALCRFWSSGAGAEVWHRHETAEAGTAAGALLLP
jgi:ATP-dependent helicase/nuclease subunit B